MRLSALKLRYKDASFISRLGLTEREVAVLEQIRAAQVAANPGPCQNASRRPATHCRYNNDYYCNPWPTLKNCFRDALAADLCAVAGLFAVVAGPLFG